MYNHNKAQQSKNRVHISWDILYTKRYHTNACYINISINKTDKESEISALGKLIDPWKTIVLSEA